MDVNLNIEKKDIDFIRDFLKGKLKPVEMDEAVHKLALYKTRDKRENIVKIYNPNCEYQVGDLIYKEYPGKIPIGSKKCIEMDRGVVLKVTAVWNRFGIEEIKLGYEGTSDFKKYTDYLQRQKIELLLPHKQSKPCEKVECLESELDPRKTLDPLVKKDSIVLKKKVLTAIHKENDISLICEKMLLSKNMIDIKPEVFNKVKDFLKESKKSESTEFLVEHFLNIKTADPKFDSYCFALNFRMKQDYKIDFQQTTSKGWGKWNLISVIYYLKKNSVVSEENPLVETVSFENKKNLSQRRKKFEDHIFDNDSKKHYLTQREIYSGALKLKSGIYHFRDSIEIEVLDSQTKKSHLLYYYHDVNLILGFKEVYDSYKAVQGMNLSFEQIGEDKFQFNIRTTKKGTIANNITYSLVNKTFQATEEKIASPVFANKSLFLESDVFNTIELKIDEYKNIATLNKLIHKIFLDFGHKEKNYEIHILRLYHILDLIYPINLKLVEEVILSNPEFIQSEKIVDIFYLDSDAVIEIEEEEHQRREILIEEAQKKRESIRQDKMKEDQQVQEEIRLKREEHRQKREGEMWMKEKLKEEKEKIKAREIRDKTKPKSKGTQRKPESEYHRDDIRKKSPAAFRPKAAPTDHLSDLDSEKKPSGKKGYSKKYKKKIDIEKPLLSKKKIDKKSKDDQMDIDEIKSEIKLEELKEKVLDKKDTKKKRKKEKEIAYKDNGGFEGILASKLDKIVQKEKKTKTKKKSK